jgi:predicted metal-dependent hydrolase
MEQLNFLFSHNKNALEEYFKQETDKTVFLTLTDNSTSMLSVKTKGNSVFVRLHWMFLHAGNDVIREIAEFIKKRRDKTPLISKFIRDNQNCLKNKQPKTVSIRTQGRYHNLKEFFNSLNNEYFGGRITASITWGKNNPRWAVRKRTLGSYSSHTNTIRINSVLDRKNVPRYFINFVIYHEMLHSDMHREKKNGRRLVHSSEFKRRERLFEHYEKAISWEKRH